MKSLRCFAPCRIDLAGGTLDIWPIHLFFDKPQTINVAVDLMAQAEIQPLDEGIHIISRDGDEKVQFASLADLPLEHPLALPIRLISFFQPEPGILVSTDSQAPRGAGLGGSSALAIALAEALNRFTRRSYRQNQLLGLVQNIETAILGVPTGDQDYYPALYGGISRLTYSVEGTAHSPLSVDPEWLEAHLILCYSGQSRVSGRINWEIFKALLDGNESVRVNFSTIVEAADSLLHALLEQDVQILATAIEREWGARRELVPSVSTRKIESLIGAARAAGGRGGKVCGAGGGGCLLFIAEPKQRKAVERALLTAGGEVLAFHVAQEGCVVEELE